MTALDRARGWFIAPPPPPPDAPVRFIPPTDARARFLPPTDSPPATDPRARFLPPADAPPVAGPRARFLPPTDAPPASGTRARLSPPSGGEWLAEPAPIIAGVASAAVLGRAGEVEPVAAALALALRRATRSRAATVAVVGEVPAEVDGASSLTAARRLGAKLEAHGLQVYVRGRLAWVRLDPGDSQLPALAWRIALVGAPAVLAVTAPRTAAIDEALGDQDLLVIVASDPEGPLARLAAAGLEHVPVLTVRPLGRGPGRALARAGVRPARSLRHLITTRPEGGS